MAASWCVELEREVEQEMTMWEWMAEFNSKERAGGGVA